MHVIPVPWNGQGCVAPRTELRREQIANQESGVVLVRRDGLLPSWHGVRQFGLVGVNQDFQRTASLAANEGARKGPTVETRSASNPFWSS